LVSVLMLDDDPSLRRDRRSTSNDYRSTRTDWLSSPRRLVFPRRETLPYVHPFFLFVHPLINRVTTSLPTLPDPPYLSPLLTRPKLLDPSPPRRRSSPPSGLSESPEPTRGTLESELHELPSSKPQKTLRRSDLALFIRIGTWRRELCLLCTIFTRLCQQKCRNFSQTLIFIILRASLDGALLFLLISDA
jgi:hypothetical protein